MISESTNRAGMTFIDGAPLMIPTLRAEWAKSPHQIAAERRVGQAGVDRHFQDHDARVRADWERIWAENAREQQA